MNPEDVKALIDQLMRTGEFLATKSFELAMKQIYTYAVLDLIVGIPALILGIWFTFYSIKNYKSSYYDMTWYDVRVGAAVLVLILGFANILLSIRYFLNPEWYAVKLLIETFIK